MFHTSIVHMGISYFATVGLYTVYRGDHIPRLAYTQDTKVSWKIGMTPTVERSAQTSGRSYIAHRKLRVSTLDLYEWLYSNFICNNLKKKTFAPITMWAVYSWPAWTYFRDQANCKRTLHPPPICQASTASGWWGCKKSLEDQTQCLRCRQYGPSDQVPRPVVVHSVNNCSSWCKIHPTV